jgi:hypothetical protein
MSSVCLLLPPMQMLLLLLLLLRDLDISEKLSCSLMCVTCYVAA